MKTHKKLTPVGFTRAPLAGALGAVLCGWLIAQQPLLPPDQPPPERDKSEKPEIKRKAMNLPVTSGQPLKANKASGLIGMEVRGGDGKELGKIHDIVLDLKSDRVAYCVLTTGRGLLGGDKLHAVPLRAFQTDPEGAYLTLNADRAKLERAEGFDRSHWPNMVNPAWGAEPFWQESPDISQPSLEVKPIEPAAPGHKEGESNLPRTPVRPEPEK